MTTFVIYLRPHCRKWILHRIDEIGDTIEVSKDPLLNNMIKLFLVNGNHKDYKYPDKLLPLKLKIQSGTILPGVSARKNVCIEPHAMIEIDRMIDSVMEHELFYMAETYSRAAGTVQKAIVDFLIKYDLDESELTHDACDKRIKRAMDSGKIDVVRRKKHHHLKYSNLLAKQTKRESYE